jgi:hypothetical protein
LEGAQQRILDEDRGAAACSIDLVGPLHVPTALQERVVAADRAELESHGMTIDDRVPQQDVLARVGRGGKS